MMRVLSTHLYLNQRLHPGLLDQAGRAGAQAIEIFAARQHFDYTSPEHVRELSSWFQSSPVEAWSMHAPLFPDREMGRAGAPAVNLLHPEKARRIDAMDEIRRALETADHIRYRNLILHLGERDDGWSPRTIEYSITALEHLGAFAHPLGVRLLVENLTSEPTTPEHLVMILQMGHLDNVGVCLDLGHAHITVGVAQTLSPRSAAASRHCMCMTTTPSRTNTSGPATATSTGPQPSPLLKPSPRRPLPSWRFITRSATTPPLCPRGSSRPSRSSPERALIRPKSFQSIFAISCSNSAGSFG
jgi:sugar phosphate isomerase/epimerase